MIRNSLRFEGCGKIQTQRNNVSMAGPTFLPTPREAGSEGERIIHQRIEPTSSIGSFLRGYECNWRLGEQMDRREVLKLGPGFAIASMGAKVAARSAVPIIDAHISHL